MSQEQHVKKSRQRYEARRRELFEKSHKFQAILDYQYPNKKRDKVFELLTHGYLSWEHGAPSEFFFAFDKHLRSHDSRSMRQLDIVKYKRAKDGCEPELVDVIECKDYSRPVGVPILEQFYGKLKGLRIEKGTIYSPRGFTAPAQNSAQANGIELVTMHWLDLMTSWWHRERDLLGCSSCSQADHDFSLSGINWTSGDIDQTRFGYCLACETRHLACERCDEIFPLEYEPPVTLRCSGCGALYFFGTRGYGKDLEHEPVEYICPEMASCLRLVKKSDHGVRHDVLVGKWMRDSGEAIESAHQALWCANENSLLEETDQELYVLGWEGQRILDKVYRT